MALVVGGFAMYWAANIEDNDMLDSRLAEVAATVLSFAETEIAEELAGTHPSRAPVKVRATGMKRYRYQVWSRNGGMLLLNDGAPSDAPLMPLERVGFERVRVHGEMYRTFAASSEDGSVIVQVAESIERQPNRIAFVALNYVGILTIPFAALFGVTWLLLRRAMRAVDSIALQLTRRNPLEIKRLEVDAPPKEMLPILASLDALFERVGRALSAERSFTSVAAHEMKTPLAGLRAQAELAARGESAEEVSDAVRAVMEGVDRASHMVDQLLDIARLESLEGSGGLPMTRVDLRSVLVQVLDEWQPRADAKNILITAKFEVRHIMGLEFGLTLALRNLVANAILYCPLHGRVHVSSAALGDDVVVDVDDSGRGIVEQEREQAFERFNRLGQSKTRGIGLGLSIVLRVVELHRANVKLSESPLLGGLRVRMSFPQGGTGAAPRVAPTSGTQLRGIARLEAATAAPRSCGAR